MKLGCFSCQRIYQEEIRRRSNRDKAWMTVWDKFNLDLSLDGTIIQQNRIQAGKSYKQFLNWSTSRQQIVAY